jgi:hypothetical protein
MIAKSIYFYGYPSTPNDEPIIRNTNIDQSSYIFPRDMKIRFMCDAGGNKDDVYIDEISVSAR